MLSVSEIVYYVLSGKRDQVIWPCKFQFPGDKMHIFPTCVDLSYSLFAFPEE